MPDSCDITSPVARAEEKARLIEQRRLDIACTISSSITNYSYGYDGPRPISEGCFKAADRLMKTYPGLVRSLFPESEVKQIQEELAAAQQENRELGWKISGLERGLEKALKDGEADRNIRRRVFPIVCLMLAGTLSTLLWLLFT
jgi:hypothetical protein